MLMYQVPWKYKAHHPYAVTLYAGNSQKDGKPTTTVFSLSTPTRNRPTGLVDLSASASSLGAAVEVESCCSHMYVCMYSIRTSTVLFLFTCMFVYNVYVQSECEFRRN